MDIADAITLLRPGAQFIVRGNIVEWLDQNQLQPTAQQIQDTISAYSYRELRRAAYPAFGDQLDALWKGGQAEIDMKATIQAVKDLYPKP